MPAVQDGIQAAPGSAEPGPDSQTAPPPQARSIIAMASRFIATSENLNLRTPASLPEATVSKLTAAKVPEQVTVRSTIMPAGTSETPRLAMSLILLRKPATGRQPNSSEMSQTGQTQYSAPIQNLRLEATSRASFDFGGAFLQCADDVVERCSNSPFGRSMCCSQTRQRRRRHRQARATTAPARAGDLSARSPEARAR